jgi:hypothetical protein
MDPHIIREKLIAFAAGDLDAPESRLVADHTAVCADCNAVVAHFKLLRYVMSTDATLEPPLSAIQHARAVFRQHRPAPVPFWQQLDSLFRLPSPRQVMIALLIALLVVYNVVVYTGISTIVAASQKALPGDSLYSVKLTVEDIQLAMTFDNAGKLSKHLDYAGFRVDETAALVNLQRLAQVPDTLAAFEKQVQLVSATYDLLVKENAARAQTLGRDVQTALAGYSAKLADVRVVAGDNLKPMIEHAISLSNLSRQAVSDSLQRLLPSSSIIASTPTQGAPPANFTSTPRPGSASIVTPTAGKSSTSSGAPASATQVPAVASKTIAPAVVNSPTFTPTKTPTATSTFVPPGQEKKTVSPTPNIPPGQENKTVSPTPKQSDQGSSKSK